MTLAMTSLAAEAIPCGLALYSSVCLPGAVEFCVICNFTLALTVTGFSRYENACYILAPFVAKDVGAHTASYYISQLWNVSIVDIY